jgi:hypothetical protein
MSDVTKDKPPKARALKFPHFRPGPHERSARALAPFGPPRADEDNSWRCGYLRDPDRALT